MGKSYSQKDRETKRFIRNAIIVALVTIIIVSAFVIIADQFEIGQPKYTAEQMSHDHNGDGIPDH